MNATIFTAGHIPTPALGLPSTALSQRQIVIMVAWGLVFWLVAALFIRYAPPSLFAGGLATALLFAATIPLAWPSVWITRRLAALGPDQLVPGATLASATAMLCDGIGLTWSSLYATAGPAPVASAAWLLWGVGCILLTASLAPRRPGA